jgi:hypothetical protein
MAPLYKLFISFLDLSYILLTIVKLWLGALKNDRRCRVQDRITHFTATDLVEIDGRSMFLWQRFYLRDCRRNSVAALVFDPRSDGRPWNDNGNFCFRVSRLRIALP